MLISRLSGISIALAIVSAAAAGQVMSAPPRSAAVNRVVQPPPASSAVVAPAAPTAASGFEIVRDGPYTIGAKGFLIGGPTCPMGKKAVGGGLEVHTATAFSAFRMVQSFPKDFSGRSSWSVAGANDGATPASVTFYATCILAT